MRLPGIISDNLIPFLALVSILMVGCNSSEPEPNSCDPNTQKLKDKTPYGVGVAIDLFQLDNNSSYEKLAKDQFSSVTAENIMKPFSLHPSEGQFFFDNAERLYDFAEENNQRLHGHTLIWHNQIPQWMNDYQGTPEQWDMMMKEHIQGIVGHFKGRVKSWDVVNEAFFDNGAMRQNIWLQNLGPKYVEKAFRYAHEADPEAILFYNDYNIALNSIKRRVILDSIRAMRNRGVPIHGLGMQMHIGIDFPNISQYRTALNEAVSDSLKIHLSELDISVNLAGEPMPSPPKEELEEQADKYLDVFLIYNQIPAQFQYGITLWGIGDGDSWIPGFFGRDDFPLLFDDNYLPKPAFCKLMTNL